MSIQKREMNGVKKYIVRYRDPDGKQRSKSFDQLKKARSWDAKRIRDTEQGLWNYGEESSITVKELMQRHTDNAINGGTESLRSYAMQNLGSLAKMKIRDVRRPHVQNWVNELRRGRSWKDGKPISAVTARTMLASVSGAFHEAEIDGVIQNNPCRNVILPPRSKAVSVKDIPPKSWIIGLANGMGKHYGDDARKLVLFAASTGLRSGELCALRVGDIDTKSLTVSVSASMRQNYTLGPTKTPSSVRKVPITPETVAEVLDGRRKRHEPLFQREGSTAAWNPRLLSAYVGRVKRWENLEGPFTLHSLRHYYAPVLLSNGATIREVQEALGHSSSSVTMDTYIHLTEGATDRIRTAAPTELWD